MAEALLTFYAGARDGAAIASALRAALGRPVHLRTETVYGNDFSDASTAERVTGQLDRCAIDLIVDEAAVAGIVGRIEALKRLGPVRWQAVALLGRGRLP